MEEILKKYGVRTRWESGDRMEYAEKCVECKRDKHFYIPVGDTTCPYCGSSLKEMRFNSDYYSHHKVFTSTSVRFSRDNVNQEFDYTVCLFFYEELAFRKIENERLQKK